MEPNYPPILYLMRDWIDTVWGNRDGDKKNNHSLLVLDAFRCHRKPSLLKYIHRQHKTENCNYPRRHDFHPTATRRRHQPSHEIHAKDKVGGVDAKREQDLHKVWTPTCPGLGHRH